MTTSGGHILVSMKVHLKFNAEFIQNALKSVERAKEESRIEKATFSRCLVLLTETSLVTTIGARPKFLFLKSQCLIDMSVNWRRHNSSKPQVGHWNKGTPTSGE